MSVQVKSEKPTPFKGGSMSPGAVVTAFVTAVCNLLLKWNIITSLLAGIVLGVVFGLLTDKNEKRIDR